MKTKMHKIASLESQLNQLATQKRAVSYDSYDISVRQLIDMVETRDIDISPEYQRHFIWDEKRSSELLESLFLGIPVPSLYMATNSDATWEVIDGVQRISTLLHFCGSEKMLSKINKPKNLTIVELEKLDTFNGMSFDEMPKSIQLQFLNRPMRVTTLNDKSDSMVRYDLFERLNTGAVRLHPQEIRHCVFRGIFTDEIKRLSKNKIYRKVVKLPSNESETAAYGECVLRFYAYLVDYKNFNHSVVDFLNDFTVSANKDPNQVDPHIFADTMDFIDAELPHGILRKQKGRTPINLYEAISVGTGLALKSGGARSGVLSRIIDEDELTKLTTGATNSRTRVAQRIEFVRDRLR